MIMIILVTYIYIYICIHIYIYIYIYVYMFVHPIPLPRAKQHRQTSPNRRVQAKIVLECACRGSEMTNFGPREKGHRILVDETSVLLLL